jgi:SAM-dependent methyltransferase
MSFPPEFDPQFYRTSHPDLGNFSDKELASHYIDQGISEGLWGSPYMAKENFLELLADDKSILEIGPFFSPCLKGKGVKYFDVLDRAGLERRATESHLPTENIPDVIHFVSPNGDLAIVDEQFDALFSSHCIEHQPNLIRHLIDASFILKPGGLFFLVIPDKRFCFDHFLPESTIADALDADDGRQTHTLKSIVEHWALTTHNDSKRHWAGDHDYPENEDARLAKVRKAVDAFTNSGGNYIDVHAWHFTPSSFQTLIEGLHRLGRTVFKPIRVFNTPKDRLEFCAILSKPLAPQSRHLI